MKSNKPIRGQTLILLIFLAGVGLRMLAWQQTEGLRVGKDIANGFYWGGEAVSEGRKLAGADSLAAVFKGYFALYDSLGEKRLKGDHRLDYPPLRLLTMTLWTWYELERPAATGSKGTPDARPLLLFNLVCEVANSVRHFPAGSALG